MSDTCARFDFAELAPCLRCGGIVTAFQEPELLQQEPHAYIRAAQRQPIPYTKQLAPAVHRRSPAASRTSGRTPLWTSGSSPLPSRPAPAASPSMCAHTSAAQICLEGAAGVPGMIQRVRLSCVTIAWRYLSGASQGQ